MPRTTRTSSTFTEELDSSIKNQIAPFIEKKKKQEKTVKSEEWELLFAPEDIIPSPSPSVRGHPVLKGPAYMSLPGGNMILLLTDPFRGKDGEVRKSYLESASKVKRQVKVPTAFGAVMPRAQALFHPKAEPYEFTNKVRKTQVPTPEMTELINQCLEILEKSLGIPLPAKEIDQITDLYYGPKCAKQGGSIGDHSDDEGDWPVVFTLSYGQTRHLVIKDKSTKKVLISVPMPDGSLIAMIGPSFQERYTHGIPYLPKTFSNVQPRISLTVRCKK